MEHLFGFVKVQLRVFNTLKALRYSGWSVSGQTPWFDCISSSRVYDYIGVVLFTQQNYSSSQPTGTDCLLKHCQALVNAVVPPVFGAFQLPPVPVVLEPDDATINTGLEVSDFIRGENVQAYGSTQKLFQLEEIL